MTLTGQTELRTTNKRMTNSELDDTS
jgi:hypothetical protein